MPREVFGDSGSLRVAAEAGDRGRLQKVINTYPQPSASDLTWPLIIAAERGDDTTVRFLLGQGAEVDTSVMPNRRTTSSIPVLQAFLDHGWDIDSPCGIFDDRTALCFVAKNEELVQWFLEHGANPRGIFPGTHTPLDDAAYHGSFAIISLLLSRGAKLEESHALHCATVSEAAGIPTMEFLLGLGCDINAQAMTTRRPVRSQYLGTPLHVAAEYGYPDCVTFLLERGADRTIKHQRCGTTPAEFVKGFHNPSPGKIQCYKLLKV
ncbi:MAG: hypothetical protein M1818_000274 [Claussenomyces sp. TS43310]|nr:MAG: hypothetical protein M1818_000274 [Claussenomyces sp. TS43310]